MDNVFELNMNALKTVNTVLYEALLSIKENQRYEVFMGQDVRALNILDTDAKELMYQKPADDITAQLKDLEQYREFDYLYFFGIGNGLIFQEILKNQKHLQVVVIEPSLELIYIALNFSDFSEAIARRKLVLLSIENLSLHLVTRLFANANAAVYARLFKLLMPTPYYARVFEKEYLDTLSLFHRAIGQINIVQGNDIKDSLIGLRHHVANLQTMIELPTIRELFVKKNSEYAVVVSTGPSLYKQLPILKQIKDYVTIISVDASLPILAREGIKPDLCTSMERVMETAEFFKKTPAAFQKGITFVCASLQHPDLIKTIKGNLVLGMRPFGYNTYFHLDDYGYVCYGMSAANMAHEIASQMGFSKCLLIGQDLSYGKDGKSHSKGHIYGDDQLEGGKDKIDKAEYELIDIEAYGGDGTVKSIYIWEAFRNYFEQTITETSAIMETVNCTEGGARIEGSTETPFHVMAEEILKGGKKKKKIVLTPPIPEVVKVHQKQIKEVLKDILKNGKILQKEIEKAFLVVQKACEKVENKTKEEAFEIMDDKTIIMLLDTITEIREKIKASNLFNEFFYEVIKPHIVHQEMDLARIKTMYVDSPEANKEKALGWILGHRFLLFSIAGDMFYVMDSIREWSPLYTKKA